MGEYVKYSKRIFTIMREYTPLVEPLSIDEAFLDVTGSRKLFGPATEIGKTIKQRIKEEVGLTASVGVAPNKFLAKLASDLEKPDGFVVIKPGQAETRLAVLPVAKLWGVGKVTQQQLAKHGVVTITDLLAMPLHTLEGIVGSYAPRLRKLARGIDDRPVVVGESSKSIGAETTFAEDIADDDRLRGIIDSLAVRVAKRVRKEGYRAHVIHLKARYADFTTVTRATTIPIATASTQTLVQTARELLETRLGRQGKALRLLGVSASGLVRPAEGEPELFPDTEREQSERVDHLLDTLQEKFGSKTIWRGYQKRPDDDA